MHIGLVSATPRFAAWRVSDLLQKPKNVAALTASYHVFGGIAGRTLCPEPLRHLVYTEIDIGSSLFILLRRFGKAAMAAFCTFEFAGVSVTRSHGPSFVSGQVAICLRQFNTLSSQQLHSHTQMQVSTEGGR
jgi:hypothetical protein